MMTNDDNVDRKMLGFSVNNSPLWLFKELVNEADRYYNGAYWPVIVGWYRKAKQLDMMLDPQTQQYADDVQVDTEPVNNVSDDNEVRVMGNHKVTKHGGE